MINVPVTATSVPEWVRKAATAINESARQFVALVGRVGGLEGRATALEAADVALDGRVDALEAFAAVPFTVAAIVLTPAALPGSPVDGMTVCDSADGKVKTWSGGAWHAHW